MVTGQQETEQSLAEATNVFTDKMYHFGEEKMQKFAELIILESKCWIHNRTRFFRIFWS